MPRLPDKSALGDIPSLRSGRAYPSAGEAKADVSGLEAVNTALAQGFTSLAGSAEKITDAELQQEDALDLIRANAAHSERLRDLQNEFATDTDWKTYRPRFADHATQSTAEIGAGIRNVEMRRKWTEQAMGRNSSAMDRVLDRGRTLQKGEKEVEIGRSLDTLRNLYVSTQDETSRKRILGDIDATVTAGQRSGLIDPVRGEEMRQRSINEALKDDAERRLLSGDAVAVMRDLGALPKDASTIAPSTGRISETGIEAIKRFEGAKDVGWDVRQFSGPYGVKRGKDERLTLQQADERLREETDRLSGWLGKNVKVPLSQEQTDALVSFGYNLGEGALEKLLPDINAGNHEKVAERMLSFNKAVDQKSGRLEELPGLVSRRNAEAEMYRGNSPAGPYARMSFQARHALITRAKISMSAESQQDLRDAYQEILETGEAKRGSDGTTALDRARLFLQPNQVKRAELLIDEAQQMHSAITPLRGMTEQQAVDHLAKYQTTEASGERAATLRKVSRAAEAAWGEIQQERLTDPVEAVDPIKNVRTAKAGRTLRADEVTGAYEVIGRRFPGVTIRETVTGGREIMDPEVPTPEALAETHRARRALIDARLDAQMRLGIPRYDRKPISKREADQILDLPENVNSITPAEYRLRLNNAADRAEAKYGKDMGPIILEAAMTMRRAGDAEHKDISDRMIARLARGEGVARSDIKRLQDLQNIESRRIQFAFPTPDDGRRALPEAGRWSPNLNLNTTPEQPGPKPTPLPAAKKAPPVGSTETAPRTKAQPNPYDQDD